MSFKTLLFILTILGITVNSCQKVANTQYIDILPISNISIPADGTSIIEIKACITKRAAEDKRTILFKSSKGAFKGTGKDNISLDAKKIEIVNGEEKLVATVSLVAPTSIGNALVTAEIEGEETSISLNFVTAAPSQLILHSSSIGLPSDLSEDLHITGKVYSSTGLASRGAEFEIKAETVPLGIELTPLLTRNESMTSNSSGDISVHVAGGNLNYLGSAILIVKSKHFSSVADTLQIQIY